MLDKLKNTKLEKSINQNSDLLILTAQEDSHTLSNITVPTFSNSSYNITNYDKTDIITIDVTNGGLRTTDYNQWLNLQTDIKNSKNRNILILMKGNLDNFTDSNERKLFIDVMCELKRNTAKNIWIISNGEQTDYSMERGIRYLCVNNENIDSSKPIDVAQKTSYILITIAENDLTYEIKNIF